jgi:predicted dehydrogenase
LIEVANAYDRKLTVGHIYHFDPPALQMRKLVENGILGEPVHIEAIMGYGLEGSFSKAFINNRNHWIYGLPGKLFQNVISHLVYKVLEFLPDETPSVQVYGTLRNKLLREKQVDILDELRVILACKGVTAYLSFSVNMRPSYPCLRVYGTKNMIEVDFNSRHVIVRRGKHLPTVVGRLLTGCDLARQYQRCAWHNLMSFLKSDYHYMAGMSHLIDSFYTSIRQDLAPPIPYSNILRTTKVMDLIFEGLPRDQRVE